MLLPWELAIDFNDQVYSNLARVFYSNMKISATRLDMIVTHVGGFPIEFDVVDLTNIIGILNVDHKIYKSKEALSFADFAHSDGVQNICQCRDLIGDICALPFRSQLLCLQVRILHIILQYIITYRKGHSNEVTRLDVGLLDSLITERPINHGYIILRHMLSTPAFNHRLLPYGNIISKILRHFQVPLWDTVYKETKRIGPEAMTSMGFSQKNGEWIKTSNSKNQDTLVGSEDDRMLNDVYPPDQLPDFRLGAYPSPPRRRYVSQPPAYSDTEEREMNTDHPPVLEPSPAP